MEKRKFERTEFLGVQWIKIRKHVMSGNKDCKQL